MLYHQVWANCPSWIIVRLFSSDTIDVKVEINVPVSPVGEWNGLGILEVITRSCRGRAIVPPGFNVSEQPNHERTDEGQNSKRLTINIPAVGFGGVAPDSGGCTIGVHGCTMGVDVCTTGVDCCIAGVDC